MKKNKKSKKNAHELSKIDKKLYGLALFGGAILSLSPYLVFLFVRNKIYLNLYGTLGYADTLLSFFWLLSMVVPLIPMIYFAQSEHKKLPIKIAIQNLLKDLHKRIWAVLLLVSYVLFLVPSLFCGSAVLDTQGMLHVYPVYLYESRAYDLSQIDEIEINFASSVTPFSAGGKIELVITVHSNDSKKYEIWHFNHKQLASHLYLFKDTNVSVCGDEYLEEWFSCVDLSEKEQILWREYLASQR